MPALQGSLTFRGPADVPASNRRSRRSCGLPPATHRRRASRHDLAAARLRARDHGRDRRRAASRTRPSRSSRPSASRCGSSATPPAPSMRELLADRGVDTGTAARADARDRRRPVARGRAGRSSATPFSACRVVVGPDIPGLPVRRRRLPADATRTATSRRADDVLAAGDATTFPVKQGGLATQQADAAAAAIARRSAPRVEPVPFAPVLRGLLLTGGAPLYLRAELDLERRPTLGRARAPRLDRPDLLARPLVAAGQGRRPLSRAVPLDRLGLALGDTSRSSTACRASARGRPRASARRHSTSRCCSPTRTPPPATYAQALHALDAAAALAGGVLPAAYAERRQRWLSETTSVPKESTMTEILVGIGPVLRARPPAFAARLAATGGASLRLASLFPYSDVPGRASQRGVVRECSRSDTNASRRRRPDRDRRQGDNVEGRSPTRRPRTCRSSRPEDGRRARRRRLHPSRARRPGRSRQHGRATAARRLLSGRDRPPWLGRRADRDDRRRLRREPRSRRPRSAPHASSHARFGAALA